jgi:hypothetical protein
MHSPPAAKKEKSIFGGTPNPGRGLRPSALPLYDSDDKVRLAHRERLGYNGRDNVAMRLRRQDEASRARFAQKLTPYYA